MKASKEESIEITLKLNKEEAKWLKGAMQNPIWGRIPEEEGTYDKSMRELFWNTLSSTMEN